MNTEIGKQRVVGWVLGKYCAKDLRYVLLDGHDAEVIRHDSVVSELNNQLEAQAAYSSMQFDRIAELTEQLSLADRLLVAEMRAKAELTAESAGYKKALEIIAQYDDGYAIPASDGPTRIDIARNALKEGV